MGHSIANVILSAETMDRLRPQGTAAIIRVAVARWLDEEADRHDSPRTGSGFFAPITPPSSVTDYLDNNRTRIVTDSAIIPVARPEDVVTTKRKVRVEVTGDELSQLQARKESESDGHHMPYSMWRKLQALSQDVLTDAQVTKTPVAPKPVATVASGSSTLVYEVVERVRYRDDKVLASSVSKADARREAVRLMDENRRYINLVVRARKVIVNDDGETTGDLLTVARPAPRGTVEVEISTERATPGAKPTEYVVAFDYHH